MESYTQVDDAIRMRRRPTEERDNRDAKVSRAIASTMDSPMHYFRIELDVAKFWNDIERVRREDGITQDQLSELTRTLRSTINRISRGGRPQVDTFLSLCVWSGLNPMNYVSRRRIR